MDVPQEQAVIGRDNLGRFTPGTIANPGGRPKDSVSLVQKLRNYLAEHPEEANKVIESLVKQGKLGNIIATKEMLDRIDGKVPETRRIEAGELPIRIVFIPATRITDDTHLDAILGAVDGEARELLGDGAQGQDA